MAKPKPAPQAKSKVNILEDAKPTTNAADLKLVTKLGQEMVEIEEKVAGLNDAISHFMERYLQIQNEQLPDLMRQCGMKEFKLDNGFEISIKDIISGSIPTMNAILKMDEFDRAAALKRRSDAFAWLRKNNADSIIKNELVAEFGKGEDKKAEQLLEMLRKKGIKATREESVHPQTLNAFLREQIREGKNIPSEPFSLYNGSKAELKPPKKVDAVASNKPN